MIPAYDEENSLFDTLDSLRLDDTPDCIALCVVNYPAGTSGGGAAGMLDRLRKERRRGVFFIDAGAVRGGVGEARKLGMDAAPAAAFAAGADLTRRIIFSLDADTLAEPGYFRRGTDFFSGRPDISGAVFRVVHQTGENPVGEAAERRYEAYLNRYVDKLRNCGSPYAFSAVGSAFAVRISDYVRCGGMRGRRGGEDFYFLQELRKCGPVASAEITVHPSARLSARVPFGTGPALQKLIRGENLNEVPDSAFADLKMLLDCVLSAPDLADIPVWSAGLPPAGMAFLKKEGFFSVWPDILRNTPPARAEKIRAFHIYFDALRTLRFLHFAAR